MTIERAFAERLMRRLIPPPPPPPPRDAFALWWSFVTAHEAEFDSHMAGVRRTMEARQARIEAGRDYPGVIDSLKGHVRSDQKLLAVWAAIKARLEAERAALPLDGADRALHEALCIPGYWRMDFFDWVDVVEIDASWHEAYGGYLHTVGFPWPSWSDKPDPRAEFERWQREKHVEMHPRVAGYLQALKWARQENKLFENPAARPPHAIRTVRPTLEKRRQRAAYFVQPR